MVLNVEPQEALDDFATADVLILSRSCSRLSGRPAESAWPGDRRPTLSPRVPDWLVAGEHGDLDAAQVATRIADQLRRRGQGSNLAKQRLYG